jgi:hypothetical protein
MMLTGPRLPRLHVLRHKKDRGSYAPALPGHLLLVGEPPDVGIRVVLHHHADLVLLEDAKPLKLGGAMFYRASTVRLLEASISLL